MLDITTKSQLSQSRAGILKTAHGNIETPFFMPIATKGAVKNLSIEDMEALEAQILLSNTYHLYLQPGEQLIKESGGLHEFIEWQKPLLTDSGGYQVFSLAGNKGKGENLVKITDEGVEFRSHLDGLKHFMSPEDSIRIQQDFGVDIMMAFDECPAGSATKEEVAKAVHRTFEWAKRCKEQQSKGSSQQQLFGIVQGGVFEDLRDNSIEQLISLDFEGYALGGLAVGEARPDMFRILEHSVSKLPEDKPRYLMGVGKPEEIVKAVKEGIDMFDCVIPTREARHGRLYFFNKDFKDKGFGADDFYDQVEITTEKYKKDFSPINADSKIPLLRNHSKAYLRHLLKTEEGLGYRLATLNNLEFYLTLMKHIREEIAEGRL